MSFDDFIFVRLSFLRGVGKAIDIGGSISRDGVLLSDTPDEADARAFAGDIRVVKRAFDAAFAAVVGDGEKSASLR